ncbi:MAG: antibiotic biosynthesis monooxygenase [Thermoleophilia bacterium]|nr:antibiotic biosynthesis monooxygenase [Thermoleophilia bacterium]MDH4345648.1 antibiotic biosynthesis monooxygenase [Thermoleophilia bacterium]MDH5333649.1 antibiotic biosynthesis monooxygenase [Thermoleophilia bacterium]
MEQHVSWVLEAAVKDGRLDAFTALMHEMVEGTSAEPQTLAYEWYISADEATVHIYEKYADSEAMVAHVSGFMEKWAGRFLECIDVTRFVVYGDPSPAARELLDGFGAAYLAPWGGFSRFA